jgi:hypothetical protein
VVNRYTHSDPKMEKFQYQMLTEGDRAASLPHNAPYMRGLSGEKRRNTALLLENQRSHFGPMNEMTKLLNIGHIDKVAFPTIRAVYPNLITNEIVSVQPMSGPVGLAFYFDVIYGSDKGSIAAGSSLFDSRVGPDGSESYIQDSVVGETFASAGSLAYGPIRPGTVTVKATHSVNGVLTFADDGNGGLTQVAGTSTAMTTESIVYSTGVTTLVPTSGTLSGLTATYRYDSEGSDSLPQVDIQLTSVPITAAPSKLRSRISWEAMMQMEAVNGMSAAQEVAQAMTEALKHGIDRKVINDLVNNAGAGSVTWDRTVPFGVSWTDHKQSFVDACSAANNLVFSATKRGNTNFMVAGVAVCDVIETLPNFVPAVSLSDMNPNSGVQFIGTLAGRWRVYKDPFMQTNKWVQGFKGARATDAGYAYCPWIPIYSSPEVILDDLVRRQAFATMYGSKMLNSNYYVTGQVIG